MKPEDSLDEAPVDESRGFYRRWSERKQEARHPVVQEETPTEEQTQPGDEDMPPIESLDEHSDYRGFLSPKVSEPLRQLALRKLFHGAAFNVCDGLDDYAEDFTKFEALGDVMTADLRHRLELEAKRKSTEEPEGEEGQAEEIAEQSDLSETVSADSASAAEPGPGEGKDLAHGEGAEAEQENRS